MGESRNHPGNYPHTGIETFDDTAIEKSLDSKSYVAFTGELFKVYLPKLN